MSFRKPCHMPFRKLTPPFTLTAFKGAESRNSAKLGNYTKPVKLREA